jgi:hypothetical protein
MLPIEGRRTVFLNLRHKANHKPGCCRLASYGFVYASFLGCALLHFGLFRPADRSAFKVPVAFEPAPGQPRTYFARGRGYILGVQPAETVLTCFGRTSEALTPVHIRFLRARQDLASMEASEPLPSRTNYYLGRNPRRWRTDVVSFGKLRVKEIYSGVDLVYYGGDRSVEYDFVVHPGANTNAIEFQISGTDDVRVGQNGDLILAVDGREARWKAPVVYQGADRRRAEGNFVLGRHNRVRFRVGDYDPTRDLVIDPTLSYSSYL